MDGWMDEAAECGEMKGYFVLGLTSLRPPILSLLSVIEEAGKLLSVVTLYKGLRLPCKELHFHAFLQGYDR